jgi:hypothetical protein
LEKVHNVLQNALSKENLLFMVIACFGYLLLTIFCQVCCIPLRSFLSFWCLLPKGENEKGEEKGVQFF